MAESFHKYRRKEARRIIRERDRSRLRELRVRIKGLRARRRAALSEIRSTCKAERERVRSEARALRAATLERLKRVLLEMRQAQRGTCETTKSEARAALGAELSAVVDELTGEKSRQAFERELDKTEAQRLRKRLRSTARERRQESDDEVRGNLPPELVSVFDRVRTKIKANPRLSRTEAFLQFAHDNPDEVLRLQEEAGERAFLEELRKHEAELRSMKRRPRRALRDPETIAAALAGVPF